MSDNSINANCFPGDITPRNLLLCCSCSNWWKLVPGVMGLPFISLLWWFPNFWKLSSPPPLSSNLGGTHLQYFLRKDEWEVNIMRLCMPAEVCIPTSHLIDSLVDYGIPVWMLFLSEFWSSSLILCLLPSSIALKNTDDILILGMCVALFSLQESFKTLFSFLASWKFTVTGHVSGYVYINCAKYSISPFNLETHVFQSGDSSYTVSSSNSSS